MKSIRSKLFRAVFFAVIALGLTACGGGGDSGSSSGGSGYSGVTTQAAISSENADDFAIPVLEAGSNVEDISPYDTATSSTSTIKERRGAMMTILAQQATKQTLSVIQQKNNGISTASTASASGDCGGTITLVDNSIYGSASGTFNATYTYSNYCAGGLTAYGYEIVVNGSMTITGSYTIIDSFAALQNLTVTVPSLALTVTTNTGSATETFSGSMALEFDGTTANNVVRMTLNMDFVAENGLTFRIQNYTVDKSVANQLNISGRFYHSLHGYVDVTTTEPFDYDAGAAKYCTGTLHIVGSGGVIDFTANASCSTYDLCITPTSEAQSCTYNNIWP